MRTTLKLGAIMLVAIALLTVGCRKDNENDTDLTSAEDQSSAEMTYDQVFKEVDMSADNAGLKKGGYPIVTIDTLAMPHTMVIDYGTVNYLCKDGNYRRGKINVSWTGRYRESGTVITITFTDFYQNDNHVEGTKMVSNAGRNASDQLVFNIVVNGKITNTSGEIHTWSSNRTRIWIAGESTKNVLSDDIYEISGTSSGTNRKGTGYTATITTNLRINLGCEWRIVSGVIELKPEGKSLRTIDYGSGNCDKLVTVTINGKSRTFSRVR